MRCGWDPRGGSDGRGARREVQLPDLTTDQKRRAAYFHASDAAAAAKLGKMDAQARRLAAKKRRLLELDGGDAPPPEGAAPAGAGAGGGREQQGSSCGNGGSVPALKAEYDAVLTDGRSDYFKQLFGKRTLTALRVSGRLEIDSAGVSKD